MAEHYYLNPRPLQIGNQGLEIKVKRATHALKKDLKNYFSNYALDRDTGMFEGVEIPAGMIEDLAIRRSLENISHNGQQVQFSSPSPVDDFPDVGMGDEEGDIDFYTEVLKTIVDYNRWLARLYPYNMVFSQYLTLVNRDKREYEEEQAKTSGAQADTTEGVGPNPTNQEVDTSTVTRISGQDIT